MRLVERLREIERRVVVRRLDTAHDLRADLRHVVGDGLRARRGTAAGRSDRDPGPSRRGASPRLPRVDRDPVRVARERPASARTRRGSTERISRPPGSNDASVAPQTHAQLRVTVREVDEPVGRERERRPARSCRSTSRPAPTSRPRSFAPTRARPSKARSSPRAAPGSASGREDAAGVEDFPEQPAASTAASRTEPTAVTRPLTRADMCDLSDGNRIVLTQLPRTRAGRP